MAEKKTGKKFVQKPKFRNEKKYKTDKTEVKKYNTFGKKKAEKKIVVKSEKHFVRYMENVVDVSFWICHMRSS